MSRYFDDELTHSGVKGMKWRKHKYRLVKDANGKLRYVYDNDNTTTGVKSSKAQHVANNQKAKATGQRAPWAADKPYQSKVEYDQAHQSFMLKERDKLRKQGDRSSVGYKDKDKSVSQMHDELYKRQQRLARRLTEGFSPESEWSNSPTLAGPGHRARAAESTARHKAAVNAQRKSKEHTARTEEATARRKAATSKYVGEHAAQQYLIKKTQEAAAEKRKKADDWRKADPSIESLGYSDNPYSTIATGHFNKGDSDRFRNVSKFHYEPSKETKKRLRRNKRKKAVADTKRAIDKGRKAVEEFFTPKKKKKR